MNKFEIGERVEASGQYAKIVAMGSDDNGPYVDLEFDPPVNIGCPPERHSVKYVRKSGK